MKQYSISASERKVLEDDTYTFKSKKLMSITIIIIYRALKICNSKERCLGQQKS